MVWHGYGHMGQTPYSTLHPLASHRPRADRQLARCDKYLATAECWYRVKPSCSRPWYCSIVCMTFRQWIALGVAFSSKTIQTKTRRRATAVHAITECVQQRNKISQKFKKTKQTPWVARSATTIGTVDLRYNHGNRDSSGVEASRLIGGGDRPLHFVNLVQEDKVPLPNLIRRALWQNTTVWPNPSCVFSPSVF